MLLCVLIILGIEIYLLYTFFPVEKIYDSFYPEAVDNIDSNYLHLPENILYLGNNTSISDCPKIKHIYLYSFLSKTKKKYDKYINQLEVRQWIWERS